jgi:hypothetical protein
VCYVILMRNIVHCRWDVVCQVRSSGCLVEVMNLGHGLECKLCHSGYINVEVCRGCELLCSGILSYCYYYKAGYCPL